MVKQWIARKKRGKRGDEVKPRWEQDYELIPNEGLFGEYLEMGTNSHRSRLALLTLAALIHNESSLSVLNILTIHDWRIPPHLFPYK